MKPKAKSESQPENATQSGLTPDKASTKAHVMDKHNRVARTYTREIHGEQFLDLAHQFASNHGFPSVVEE